MTDVLQRSPSHFPSPSSSSTANDGVHTHPLINSPTINHCVQFHLGSQEEQEQEQEQEEREGEGDQLSVLTFLVAAFRKSLIGCRSTSSGSGRGAMEIGWPSNVRHVAHVTFDRFNGFLGLPVEFELEVPRRAPSARFIISLTLFLFWISFVYEHDYELMKEILLSLDFDFGVFNGYCFNSLFQILAS